MEIVIPSSEFTRIKSYQAVSSHEKKSLSSESGSNKVLNGRARELKNSLCFRRSLKEKERRELELEKEKAKTDIDVAEEAYQAMRNSDVIERANLMMYVFALSSSFYQ